MERPIQIRRAVNEYEFLIGHRDNPLMCLASCADVAGIEKT